MINYLLIIQAMVHLVYAAFVRNRRQAALVVQQLNAALVKHGMGQLSKAEAKRIGYYTMQSTITALWFGSLHKHVLTAGERKAKRFAGALTVFQDDLTDNPNYPYQSFMDLATLPEEKVLHHREEWIAWYCYQTMLQTAPFANEVKRTAILAEQGQQQSRRQLQGGLSAQELIHISYHKGGAATLFYRSMMGPEISEKEEALVYECGELLQWCNDIFDVHKDYHAGVQTMFNSSNDLRPWKTAFEKKLLHIRDLLTATNAGKKASKSFWAQYLAVVCRGLVCFDQLIALQATTEEKFKIEQYERKATICDMEKRGNIWASVRYAAKFVG